MNATPETVLLLRQSASEIIDLRGYVNLGQPSALPEKLMEEATRLECQSENCIEQDDWMAEARNVEERCTEVAGEDSLAHGTRCLRKADHGGAHVYGNCQYERPKTVEAFRAGYSAERSGK